MNFTPDLTAFQGAIISADNVHQFSKIKARGGHEDEIQDIITRLLCFLREKRFILTQELSFEKRHQFRRFAFYLILNADFPILEDLVELPGIDMAIWTIPTISKCLVCELFWGLNMDNYLYEIISLCYPTFSLQVLEPFVDNLKYDSPVDCVKKIKLLTLATYRLIARFIFFNYEISYVRDCLTKAYEHFLNIIEYFIVPPNEYQLNGMDDDEKYKYQGNNLYSLLNLILEILAIFTSIEVFDPEGLEEIYLWTIKPENIKSQTLTFKVCDSPDELIIPCLEKCNQALMDRLKTLVMAVSVDIFCAWSEYEDNTKTLQQSIGELCYLLHSKANKVPSLAEHPVVGMLPQISRKPVDIHDIILLADDETIVENINKNDENKKLWLEVILKKEDSLLNKDFVQCLISNIDCLDADERNTLLDNIINDEPQEDIVRRLAVELFIKCDINKKNSILDEYFNNKTFTDGLETSDVNIMITEIFNKLIASQHDDISNVLCVFLQNPHKTYTKILNSAIENIQQCDIMLKIMKLIDRFSCHYYRTDMDACIIKTIQEFSQNKLEDETLQQNFINFVTELKKSNMLPAVKLFLLIVMPNLHNGLVNKRYNVINIQIELLNTAFSIEDIVEYRAPLLAMLAQVLQVVRWSFSTYTGAAPAVLENALQLQMKIFNTYNGEIPVKDSSWLKSKLRDLSALNMFYYRLVWNPPGSNMIEIISGETNLPVDKLELLLAKVLCMATSREWSDMWDCLSSRGDDATLSMFYNAVTLMSVAEKKNRTENTWACLANCYRNLMLITKDKYLKEPLTNSQVEAVVDKLTTITKRLSERDVDELSAVFLSLLSYVTEKKDQYSHDITTIRDKIQHPKFLNMVVQLLTYWNLVPS